MNTSITTNDIEVAIKLGEIAFKSGICKTQSPFAATVAILKGQELGFSPMASLEMVQVIQGNVGLSPKGAMAIMSAHPEIIEDVKIEYLYTEKGEFFGTSCTIKRKGRAAHTEKFTLDDARNAGLIRDDSGWKKYPQKMTTWRAVGFAADIVCADLLGGLTRFLIEPELYNVQEIAEAESHPMIEAKEEPIKEIEAPAENITIESLLKQYGAATVVKVSNGILPQNAEDIRALAAKLQEGEIG